MKTSLNSDAQKIMNRQTEKVSYRANGHNKEKERGIFEFKKVENLQIFIEKNIFVFFGLKLFTGCFLARSIFTTKISGLSYTTVEKITFTQ